MATHVEAVDKSVAVLDGRQFRLTPVGAWILNDPELMAEFSHWRFLAKDMYFAQFPESASGMRRYLEDVSIGRDDAILFVIEGVEGNVAGHIGLTNARLGHAQIDSVMKSPHNSVTGTMSRSLAGLMTWSCHQGIEVLSLRVSSRNTPAISLYESAGFKVTDRFSLYRTEMDKVVSHREVPAKDRNVDYQALVMEWQAPTARVDLGNVYQES
jgi:RimJ/RimL family protein N-acetyltransferase